MKENKKIIVTSALPYANGPIHIGHLVEYIQTDIYVRFFKLLGKDAVYCCADDTHGAPIEINAGKEGMTPEEFIKKWHKEHVSAFDSYHIKFDSYYTTHSPENKHYTELIFKRLKDKGLIYTKDVELTYCNHCKRFLPDRYVKGKCPKCGSLDQYGDVCEKCNATYSTTDLVEPYCSICKSTPVRKNSTHYFFKLSDFNERLTLWLSSNKSLQPEIRNQILSFIRDGLQDWCISRDGPYFGFKIPGEENKFFYVWLDAPIGYIASTANYCKGKNFSADDIWQTENNNIVHFIGKDIIYFHLLFWPAVLMGADFKVPDSVIVHGFLTVNGEKMSKSRGTFLSAKEFLSYVDPEFLRYYYASNLTKTMTDIDLDLKNLTDKINNELVSNIANFIYRTLSFTLKNYDGELTVSKNKELIDKINEKCELVKSEYENLNFREAVKHILEISTEGNRYFQENAPWELKKTDVEKTRQVLTECAMIAKAIAITIKPIFPIFSKKIEEQLGLSELSWTDLSKSLDNHKIAKAEIVFSKVDEIKLKETENKEEKINYSIEIDDRLSDIKIAAALIKGVTIKKKSQELETIKQEYLGKIVKENYSNDSIISGYADIYRQHGLNVEPNALGFWKLAKEDKFPQINSAVDAYNLVAVKYKVSAGCHDISKIKGNQLKLKITQGNEKYTKLGTKSAETLIAGEIAFVDEEKVLCWFDLKQCDETKTSEKTKNILLYVQGNKNTPHDYLKSALDEMCKLMVKINGGQYMLITECCSSTDPFSALDLRVAQIVAVKKHPKADKLYIEELNLGTEKRQIISGLAPYYSAEELVGKKIILVANLEAAKLRGEMSYGMLLAGEDESHNVGVLTANNSVLGDRVFVEGIAHGSAMIKYDDFTKAKMAVVNGKAIYKEKNLRTKSEEVICEKVVNGTVS
ncbi:MAG: methionine--tRNA ligase [archaeon]